MDTNIILSICQIVAVALVPFIVWYIGCKWQDRKAREDAKRELFLTLMANRQCQPLNKEWVDALNKIDVVFQDDKKVRVAWRAYFDSLDPNSQYNKNKNSYLLDLLSEMANSLGYNNLKQTEIDRTYTPQGFVDSADAQYIIHRELIRVLTHSKSNAEGFTDKEYEEHLAELKKNN